MADLDQMFARLDLLDPPDVSEEIERRVTAPSPAIPPPPKRRRLAAGLVAAAIVTAVAVLAWIVLSPVSEREHEPPPATMANWQDVETGWTRLADLPTPLQGSVRVWADGSLIVWGGNEGDGAGQSSQGWRLDRVDGSWRTIASSPLSPRSWAAAAWTGSELLIWGGASGTDPMSDPLADGAAYDPATDTWRSLAPAPLTARSPLTSVWTGSRWLIWGEGPSRTSASAMDGAAYDPIHRYVDPDPHGTAAHQRRTCRVDGDRDGRLRCRTPRRQPRPDRVRGGRGVRPRFGDLARASSLAPRPAGHRRHLGRSAGDRRRLPGQGADLRPDRRRMG